MHQSLEQAALCDADLVGEREWRFADDVLDVGAELLRNVLHEGAAARDYLEVVRDAFDRIALGTAKITRQHKSAILTVSTSPDFAANDASAKVDLEALDLDVFVVIAQFAVLNRSDSLPYLA